MNSKRIILIIGGILVLLGAYTAISFNGFVKKEEEIKLKWAEVQNVYQRRMELIPNLVNIVQGLAEFEKSTFTRIAEARSQTATTALTGNNSDTSVVREQLAAQDTIAAAANRLIVAVEKYPQMKGTAAFAGLQTQLEGTERRIKIARKDFNEAVATYNQAVRSFPSSLPAKILGFSQKPGFEAIANADKAIEIKFN